MSFGCPFITISMLKCRPGPIVPPDQGSKIAPVRSYLRVPQAAEQVKIVIFLVKIKFFSMYANIFCDAGKVPILRYFEACRLYAGCTVSDVNHFGQQL